MILGIGIDILETGRMTEKVLRSGFVERFMHPSEIAYAHESGESEVMIYASRFAAKEAFGKALGTGLRGLRLRDIAVEHDGAGRPYFSLYDTAQAALDLRGGSSVHLSISHQASMVAAVVVIEGEPSGA
jgi:holo-[acyl-carrier protein] synthase